MGLWSVLRGVTLTPLPPGRDQHLGAGAPCPQCCPAYAGAHVCLALVFSGGRKTHPSKQDCHLLHP